MAYLGIQTQIRRNNRNSVLLLILFPLVLLGMVYAVLFFSGNDAEGSNYLFMQYAPFVIIGTGIWFAIAYFSHTSIINRATGAKPLERRENPEVYNLLENLCISQGMRMPKLCIIDDDSLNAYASGINEETYTVSLTRGIIAKLNKAELEGVIAHELAHIRNRDTRLLIITIVFVGIFAFISQVASRHLLYSGGGRRKNDGDGGNAISMLVVVIISAVAYLIAIFLRFAISRSREYMADAGAAEMTRDPLALASALRKISGDPYVEAIKNEDVAQLFIEHPSVKKKNSLSLNSLFATHPPIQKRIEILEKF